MTAYYQFEQEEKARTSSISQPSSTDSPSPVAPLSTQSFDKTSISKAWETLETSKNIVIISHRGPDPDTIGSNLALYNILENLGKNIVSACVDAIPQNYLFLKHSNNFVSDFKLENFHTIVSVDCGSRSQVAFGNIYPDLFNSNKPFINIDHHVSNDHFGTINLVELNLSSTCEIVYRMLEYLKQKITPEIATCLLFGLYYDTGSFMHSNTTAQTLEVAEKLLSLGANLPLIIQKLYHNFNEAKFHLWGQALSSIKITKQKAASSIITSEDFQKTHAHRDDLSGVIDYISMTEKSHYGMLLTEDGKGNIKGSLRTKSDEINLSELAKEFGGGGHRKASGFSLKGSFKKETAWVIEGNEKAKEH